MPAWFPAQAVKTCLQSRHLAGPKRPARNGATAGARVATTAAHAAAQVASKTRPAATMEAPRLEADTVGTILPAHTEARPLAGSPASVRAQAAGTTATTKRSWPGRRRRKRSASATRRHGGDHQEGLAPRGRHARTWTWTSSLLHGEVAAKDRSAGSVPQPATAAARVKIPVTSSRVL